MSYTTLHGVTKDGKIFKIEDYRNSWLFAPYVWASLSKKYFGRDLRETEGEHRMQPLWDLAKSTSVPEYERLTLMTTFDHAMLHWDIYNDVRRLAMAYREFSSTFAGDNHLIAMLDTIEHCLPGPNLQALCWTATSAAGDMWLVYVPEEEEYRPYDLTRDTKHWFIELDATKDD